MPKLKSNSGAKKRLKVSASGTVKRYQAGKRHLLTGKSAKRKRTLSGTMVLDESDRGRVNPLLPYA